MSRYSGKANGRGIAIYDSGHIWIGRTKDNASAEGRFIQIYNYGVFELGEYYLDSKEKIVKKRYTRYNRDGTCDSHGFAQAIH